MYEWKERWKGIGVWVVGWKDEENEWMSERMDEWKDEWVKGKMKGNRCMSKRMKGWRERMNEWKDGWPEGIPPDCLSSNGQ